MTPRHATLLVSPTSRGRGVRCGRRILFLKGRDGSRYILTVGLAYGSELQMALMQIRRGKPVA
jgi:hypothetical protein